MDLTESEKIVKDILEKQGYKDYKIITHYTTVGTNVTTTIAKKNDSEIVLTIAEGIKQIIGNNEIVTHTIFIEEPLSTSMGTSNNIVTLTFDLEQPIPIGGSVTNRNDVELVMSGTNCIGIKICVNDTKDETVKGATEITKRITNYLSHQTNFPTKLKKPRITVIRGNKMTHTLNYTVDAVVSLPCDIDLQNISILINNDSDLNQRLIRYNEGIRALNDNDFAGAVQLFHQSIENSGIKEEEYYKILRHAASHLQLDSKDVSDLQKFGIIMNPGDKLNRNDPKIQFILEIEARKLQSIAMHYISDEIKKNSMNSRW